MTKKLLIIKKDKNEKSITGDNKKKAQPIQKLIDTRKEWEGSDKVRTFPTPSAPKLSLFLLCQEKWRETKSQEKMTYSTALLSQEGPFHDVTRKKKFKKKKDIKGNGEHNEENFSATTKLVSLYIVRCSMKSTDAGLISFCEKNEIKNITVTELNVKSSWYKSCKITMEEKYLEKWMKPEFWSKGIIVYYYIVLLLNYLICEKRII